MVNEWVDSSAVLLDVLLVVYWVDSTVYSKDVVSAGPMDCCWAEQRAVNWFERTA